MGLDHPHTDVFIAGGGPAGLAAAIAARRYGLDVTVADPGQPGIDKACGEGLLPAGLAALRRLGVQIPAGQGFPLQGIRFIDGSASVQASFPSGPGLGLRRTSLHRILADHAAQCGVTLLWDTPVEGLNGDKVLAGGRAIRCRFLIGADGASSAVRRWAGLDTPNNGARRFGFRRHFRVRPWSNCVEVHWARGCQIYVTPVAGDEVGVALLTRDRQLRLEPALTLFPELAARLRFAQPASSERGAVTSCRRFPKVCTSRIALCGDASGSVDAIAGEGLGLAFRQAEALARALASGDLSSYPAAHARIRRAPAFMAQLLLMLDRGETLRRRAISAFSAHPSAFAGLLAAHKGLL